ncbi:MAG TPA: isocitrate lyase/phosphoenolpyruvate mutase family protein, partial [Ktedonobacteraceae bacterium]|nr:isocitrate lyase/phosphoenolpyruvate mutase family protein [Ktedonobacteraceae bacterium]
MQSQQAKAEALSQWHQKNSSGLLLPNAWDCASARVFEAAGFPVVGTTSMGVAFAQGYQDGEQISPDEMLRIIARITATVQVPVTADIEAGYGSTPQELAQTIQKVIATGVAGINLEDSQGVFKPLYSLEEQCERLAAARTAAEQANLALFINARIDTYLFQIGEEQTRLEETVRRARAYLQAGASGIFVPGVVD